MFSSELPIDKLINNCNSSRKFMVKCIRNMWQKDVELSGRHCDRRKNLLR